MKTYSEKYKYSEKKSYGDKPAYGEKKSYGEKSYGSKSYGEKKTYGEKSYGEKRAYGQKKSYGDKPYGEKKFYGEKSYGEKSYGEKKAYGKPYEGKKSFDKKPYGKSAYGEKKDYYKKPYGAKKGFEKKTFGVKKDYEKKASFRQQDSFADTNKEKDTAAAPERDPNIICGRNAVIEAVKSGMQINKVMLSEQNEQTFAASVFRICKEYGVPCHQIPRAKLVAIAGQDHHGIAAEVASVEYAEVDDILAAAKAKNEPPFLILLDNVEDPHNLGAVIRTALCVGAHGVVIPKNRSAAVNATVMKTSAGGAAYLPIARVTNLCQTIESLKAAGVWVAAADMDGTPMWQADLTGPLAVVMGAEGDGVSPLVKKSCDLVVSIPMKGPLDSLNISNAAAVLMYESLRQKQK